MSRVWLDEDEMRNAQILQDDIKRNLKIVLDFIRHHHPLIHPPRSDHALQPRHLRRDRT